MPSGTKNRGRKAPRAAQTNGTPKSSATTIAVSPQFAEAIKEIARAGVTSVAAVLDRDFLPGLQSRAAEVLRQRLVNIEKTSEGK